LLLVNNFAAGLHDRVALLFRRAIVRRVTAADVSVAGPTAERLRGVERRRGQQHRDNRHAQKSPHDPFSFADCGSLILVWSFASLPRLSLAHREIRSFSLSLPLRPNRMKAPHSPK